MAQRTGAERLLASPAKTASAGAIPALAVAVLLLAGCGGGTSTTSSSSTGSASAPGASSASKSASAGSSATGAAGSKTQGKAGEGAPAVKGASGPGSAASAAQGQKHAPPIAAPKGPPEQAPSPEQVAHATLADISLQSPAIVATQGSPGRLAATFTCDGKDSWPALRWSGVPPGSEELILYAMNVQPVEGQLFVDWALAGLDPGLEEIGAGELPRGAVVGKNSFGRLGYSLCPTGDGEIYMFALYALPQSLELSRGFDAREVRKRILDVSGDVGLLPAVYERG